MTVTSDGDYRLVQAPKGTFFEGNVGRSGENKSNWVSMKTQHCTGIEKAVTPKIKIKII